MSDAMDKRRKAIKSKMAALGLDSYLIGSNDNKHYLVDFEDTGMGIDSFLLLTQEKDYLIVEFCDDGRANRIAPFCEVLAVADKEPLGDTIKRIVEKEKLNSMGFERKVLKNFYHGQILDSVKGLQLIPVDNIVEKMRMIKDPGELELISKAVLIGDETFSNVIQFIKPGVTEKELAWEIESYGRKEKGAESLSFPTILASGVNSSLPHGLASDKKFENGDFITLDFGFVYNGYCGDMTRTVVLGNADEKQREVYRIVQEAQLAGVHAAKAGLEARELDKVARDVVEGYGYGKYFGHELGHSIGLRVHEDPWLGDYNPTILEPGMVVTIEPGIYIPGWGGCRIEDTVVIEQNGCRVLTRTSKDLMIV